MALAGKIAYNVAYSAVAKVLSTVLALVIIGFITRYLGKEGFGDYATILAFFAFFNAIGDLGLQTVTAREISRPEADESKIMSGILTLRMFISIVIVALSPLIGFLPPYAHNTAMQQGIMLAAIAFFFSSVSMILNGVFQKHLVMDRVATVEIGGKFVQIAIVLAAVHFDWGFSAIVIGLLGYMIFNAVIVFALAKRYVSFSLSIDRALWQIILKQSLPLGVSAIVTFLYFKADTILLSIFASSADVGIYGAAYKVIENLVFFPAMIAGLVLPVLSRFAFTDHEKFTITADKMFKVFFVMVVPLTIGVVSLAPTIIDIIGGADFVESYDVLRLLAFALAFIFLGQFFNTILIVNNLQNKLMSALIVAAIVNISLNLVIIPRYTYFGAAVSSVITEALVALFSFLLVRKYVHYRPNIGHFSAIVASGVFMGLFLFATAEIHFVWRILGSIVLYFGSLWITKGIDKQEIAHIIAGSKKEASL